MKKSKIVLITVSALIILGAMASLGDDTNNNNLAGVEVETTNTKSNEPVEKETTPIVKEETPKVEPPTDDAEKKDTTSNEDATTKEPSATDIEAAEHIMSEIITPFLSDSTYVLEGGVMTIYLNMSKEAYAGFILDYKAGGDKWNGICKNMDTVSENSSSIAAMKGGSFAVAVNLVNPANKENIIYSTLNGVKIYDSMTEF